MKKAFVAGSIGLDIIPIFGDQVSGNFLAQGKFNDMRGTRMYLGGCVGNTGIAMAKLGVQTSLYSKVGSDDIGMFIKALLSKENYDIKLDLDERLPSSSTVVIAPPGSDRILLHSRGASQTIVASDLNEKELSGCDLFHFGYPTAMRTLYINDGVEFTRLMQKVHSLGLTTSLDTSQPDPYSEPGQMDWKGILKRTLPFVDVFLPSLEELLFMTHKDVFDDINRKRKNGNIIDFFDLKMLPELADELLAQGPSIVCIKLGQKGVYLRTAPKHKLLNAGKGIPEDIDNWASRELFRAPYVSRNIRSTTGAGDTMIAGFLSAMLAGYGIEETLALSQANAKRCIESFKTTDNTICLEQLRKWCSEKPEMMDANLDIDYWKYDENYRYFWGKLDSLHK